MTSSIINFVINKFLSNFLEINPNQVYISLLSGELNLKNIKIKQKALEYINIDYLQLINGYIGSLRILLQMPYFYENPISIYINDIYVYAKQKKIENINESNISKYLRSNKINKLSSEEQIYQQIDEMNNVSENFVNQLINNLNIYINNIIFRFEDDISNPKIPFSLGLIVNSLNIISFNELLEHDNNSFYDDQKTISRKSSKKLTINKNSLYLSDISSEISDKKIIVKKFYLFMDCFDKTEELKFDKLIEEKMKIKSSEIFDEYIDEMKQFYYYCQSELNVHCNNKNIHEYIFYKLNLDINFSMNFNLENNNPQYKVIINDINEFNIYLTIKQLTCLFNLLSYYNLYSLYQIGLKKSIFNINLNQTEMKTYVMDYMDYYYNKYIKKNAKYNLSNFIQEKEDKMTYEDIKKLRKVALKTMNLYIKIKDIEEEINKQKGTWTFFRSSNDIEINELENNLKNLKQKLNDKIIKLNKDKEGISYDQTITENSLNRTSSNYSSEQNIFEEKDPYSNLPDTAVLYLIQMSIKKMNIIIYDDELENENDKSKKRFKKIIDMNISDFFIKISVGIKIFNMIFNISDINIAQGIVKSIDYDVMLMTEPEEKEKKKKDDKKVLKFEFEINPLENYTYKMILINEKKMIFVMNLYILQYIIYKILSAIFTSISFLDLSHYAQGNINKYLRIGYLVTDEKRQKKNKKIKQYCNYNCKIDIISPLIIVPQNIMDIYNNKCIIIKLENISLKTDLVSKAVREYFRKNSKNIETNEVYSFSSSSSKDDDLDNLEDLYDIYNLAINGFEVLLSNECIKKNMFNLKYASTIIKKTDILILYKTLTVSEMAKLNNVYLNISINKIDLNLDEFHILLLIVFFKQMRTQSDLLHKLQKNRNQELDKLAHTNFEVMEVFKEHLIEKGVLNAEENKKIDTFNTPDNTEDKNIDSYTNEEDFLNKKNEYFYEVDIKKIKLTIYKKFPDLSNKAFLETGIDSFQFLMCGNQIKDSLMKVSMKNITVYDKEKSINDEYLVIKEYQTLIQHNNKNKNVKNEDIFSYMNIYINNLKENISEIKFSNIDIIMTFDSLTRIYIFSMYYYKIFYENYLNTNKNKNQNINLSDYNGKLNKSLTLINKESKIIANNDGFKKETIKNKFIFQIKIINNNILLPYDPSSLECPIISLRLNMFYDQSSDSETIQVFDTKKKKLVKKFILPNNSNLNLMIYESDFDIIKYSIKKKEFIYNKRINKILSNYRIQFNYKYSNLQINKQSLADIDILIEPIIIDICLDQLKDILIFYNQSMKFLYENLYEYYIPYIKPENVIYFKGKPYIDKKKLTFKKLSYRIYILIKIRKSFDDKHKKIFKKENKSNSLSGININMNKATVTIFDNALNEKTLLLEIKMTKMDFKSINNSNPKDKNNVFNELLSILTGTNIPFKNYTIHNLYKYMHISFILEFNYYNLEYSSFEPIIEPLPFQFLAYQVDKIFRHKTLIKSDNILNFNVSSNCIKVLNLFLSKYYSDNDLIKRKSNMILKERQSSAIRNSLKDDKVVLCMINKTGLPIRFWFDFNNEEIYNINNREFLNFSNKTLYKNRRQQIKIQQKIPAKNTFSFQVLGCEVIQNINLNKNNILYFKTFINDKKYLLYNVHIDTSGIINQIKFESSINFYNKTVFEELILSIDDNNIKDNCLDLKRQKKLKIPLSWMLSESKIYLQLNKKAEKHLLYNNILGCCFCQKLNDEELENKKNERNKVKENLTNALNTSKEINLQHPKYKEYISSFISREFNIQDDLGPIKRTTIIDESNNNKSYSFNLNYLALSFNEKNKKHTEEIYNKLKCTKKSYKYLIIMRPIISITNYIPFNIMCTTDFNKNKKGENINEDNTIDIAPLKSKEIYDINWALNKNKSLFKLSLIYEENIFNSKYFPLMEDTKENLFKKVTLKDKKSNSLISNILVQQCNESIDSLLEVVEQFSISSIHFILFFDYIINNRMDFNIYAKVSNVNGNKNEQNNTECLFEKKKLYLLSSTKDIFKLNISATHFFDEKNQHFLNSIGLNKNIELIKDSNVYNVSCTTLNSVDFIYSNIVIFEPKYILINNLDFDIYYYQITKEKKKSIKTLKKDDKICFSYKQTSDKKLFKFGLKFGDKYSWSGPFNIDESKDYDYKIEVNKDLLKKYRNNAYTSGKRNYIYFRIKCKIYQYTTYIILSFCEFPDLEIINRTTETIEVYEEDGGAATIIEPRKDIPFIWENATEIKEALICKIKGCKHYFTYSAFEENRILFDNEKYINIGVRRNKTGSRCLILEETGLKRTFRSYFMKKQLKILSEMIIDLKGIGLSFLDETPKEIFFISFYGMKLIYRNTMLLKNKENIEHINFYLKNFQIDYCLNDSLKSLIYPKIQKIPSLEEQNVQDGIDFIMIFIERTSYFNSEKKIQYMNYNKIAFCFQEMNVKINQIILFHLISLIQGYTSLLDYAQKIKKNNDIYVKEENLIENNDKYIETLKKENLDKNKTLINFLILSSLKINITLRIDLSNIEISFLPDIISNIIISLGSSLIRITESPLSFSPKVIKDIYMDTNMIISILIKEFTTEGILQIYKILGSTDLIGNPVNLIDKIGNGFFELVNEPTKGLMQGPTQFTKGLAKGVTGLLNGVVGGSMDSVSRITGTLYTTVHGILGKKEAQLMDEDDEPQNLFVGVAQGITGGYQELKEGLTGFFVNPFQNAQKEGAVGFIQGLSTGIFGLAISPFAFALKLGGSLAVGTKNTFAILYNKSQKNQRFRFPRYIEESKPLQIYDSDLSAAYEFLSKSTEVENQNPIILYFSSFILNNDGYNNKLAFLIVTKQMILILSNENKILLNIKISDLKDIKLYYLDDNFNLVLEPKSSKHKKEKRLIIDKSCVIMACHFYDILKEEINLLSL